MRLVLWGVDAQADFTLPGGKLYVPGAEKIIPNINRLVDQARQGHVLLISSADAHHIDDPEFQQWPPHCVKGTPGAELIPEARAASQLVIPNQREFVLPRDLGAYQQVILEKNTLDVFDNPNTDALLARVDVPSGRSPQLAASTPGNDARPEFLVFGVVTEHCVRFAADGLLSRGRRVSIVEDAIQSLDDNKGREVLEGLQARGARFVTTDRALTLIDREAFGAGKGGLYEAVGS
jgi:nicotinamidase/pyrazinamidase